MKDELNKKYGKLTVLKREPNNKFGTTRWLCSCECGKQIITNGQSLRNGQTKSCGCLNFIKKRSGNIIYNKLFSLTRNQAQKANIPFELTIEQVKEIVVKNCAYCGQKPYLKRKAYHRTAKTIGVETDEFILINGIDKVEPKKGYIISNCVSCCKYCNRAKSDLSVEEFKLLISKIYKNICI